MSSSPGCLASVPASQVEPGQELGRSASCQMKLGLHEVGPDGWIRVTLDPVGDDDASPGQVKSKTSTTALLRIQQDAAEPLQEKAGNAAMQPPRHDLGKPTEKFEVGHEYEVLHGLQVRKDEDLASDQVRILPNRSRVKVVQIGTGPTGRRICISDECGRSGWVSVTAGNGEALLKPVPARQQCAIAQTHTTGGKVDVRRKEEPPEPAEPIDVVITWSVRETAMQRFIERLCMEGVLPPTSGRLRILDSSGHALQSWNGVGCQASKAMFPLTLRFHPSRPGALERVLRALAPASASEATEGVAGRLHAAAQSGDLAQVRSAIQESLCKASAASASRVPGKEALAAPTALPKGLVCPPLHKPLQHLGKWYFVRGIDNLVFQPGDPIPKGIWNGRLQRVEPVVGRTADSPHAQIAYFSKNYALLHGSKLFDPDTQHVIARLDRESLQVKRCEPVPIAVSNFLEERGFLLESSTSSSAGSSFLQILKSDPAPGLADREEALASLSTGSWKVLRFASSELRGDRELVLKAFSRDADGESWRMLMYAAEQLQRDPEVALQAVRKDARALCHVHPTLLEDFDFMLDAVREQGLALRYASDELRADREIAVTATRSSWQALQYVDPQLLDDPELIEEGLLQSWRALEFAGEGPRGDRRLLLSAVKQHGFALQFATEALRSDPDVVMAAVQSHPDALQFATQELAASREFMLAAVQRHGQTLRYAAAPLRADAGLVTEAVQQCGCALCFASPELAGDRDLVIEAVRQDPKAIRFASRLLLKDSGVVLACLGRDVSILENLPEELKMDKDFILEVVRLRPDALKYAAADLRADRTVAGEAAMGSWRALRYVSEVLLNDREFMLTCVRVDGNALAFAAETLRADSELVLAAAQQGGPELLEYAAPSLCADLDFMGAAVKLDGKALQHAALPLRADRSLVIEAVTRSGAVLEHAAEALRADREVVLVAAGQDLQALSWAARSLWDDQNFVQELLARDGLALRFVPEDLRGEEGVVLAAVRQNWRAIKHAARALRESSTFMQQAVAVNGLVFSFAAGAAREDPQLLLASTRDASSSLESSSFSCTEVLARRPPPARPSNAAVRLSGLPLPAFAELEPDGKDELVAVALRQLGLDQSHGRAPTILDATLESMHGRPSPQGRLNGRAIQGQEAQQTKVTPAAESPGTGPAGGGAGTAAAKDATTSAPGSSSAQSQTRRTLNARIAF